MDEIERLLSEATKSKAASVSPEAPGLDTRLRREHKLRRALALSASIVVVLAVSASTLALHHSASSTPLPVVATPKATQSPKGDGLPAPLASAQGPAHIFGKRGSVFGIYDSVTGKLLVDLTPHFESHNGSKTATAIGWIPGQPRFYVASSTGCQQASLTLYDDAAALPANLRSNIATKLSPTYHGLITDLAVSPDGTKIAISLLRQTVTANGCNNDADHGDLLEILSASTGHVLSGGNVLKTIDNSGAVSPGSENYVSDLSWSPDNRHLLFNYTGCCGGGNAGYGLLDSQSDKPYDEQTSKAYDRDLTQQTRREGNDAGAEWLPNGNILVNFTSDPRRPDDLTTPPVLAEVDPRTGSLTGKFYADPKTPDISVYSIDDQESGTTFQGDGFHLLATTNTYSMSPYLVRIDNGVFSEVPGGGFAFASW